MMTLEQQNLLAMFADDYNEWQRVLYNQSKRERKEFELACLAASPTNCGASTYYVAQILLNVMRHDAPNLFRTRCVGRDERQIDLGLGGGAQQVPAAAAIKGRVMSETAGWEVEGFIERLNARDDKNSERLVLEAISHLRAFSRDCDALRDTLAVERERCIRMVFAYVDDVKDAQATAAAIRKGE